MTNLTTRALLFSLLSFFALHAQGKINCSSALQPLTAIEAAQELVGLYSGQWELFGLDTKNKTGTFVSRMRWKDEVSAMNPTVEETKAYVLVMDKMIYDDGHEEMSTFTEGYLLNPDKSVGARYFDTAGTVVLENPVGPATWIFTTQASKMDLALMGFGPSMKPVAPSTSQTACIAGVPGETLMNT